MHGRTKSIRRCKNIEELLDDGGQICRGWHIIPLLQQLAVSLKALRFFVEAMPHQHGRDPAHNPGVFPAEIQDRNHSVIRIA